MSTLFNYRHLYYFWVVAKEGGLSRAADRLGMAVQTIGTQVHELEKSLGYALLKPAGRGLVLTEAGVAAMQQADLIFQMGEQLPMLVRDAASMPRVRLALGIADSLPKLAVHRLLKPVLQAPHLRLLCKQDEFTHLLADLALHRFDLVLADRPATANPNIKLYNHRVGSSAVEWYASAHWHAAAQENFPHSLGQVPLLLPTADAAVRVRIDQWLEGLGVRPRIVGEFEDSALLKTFGASGMGVFPAAQWVREELASRYGVHPVGPCTGVQEHFYAIGTEKKVHHPLVQQLLQAAQP